MSLDDRKQKHVSFDSSSLMRSQTLATMDEATFHRMQAAQMAQSQAQQAQVNLSSNSVKKTEIIGKNNLSMLTVDFGVQRGQFIRTSYLIFSTLNKDAVLFWEKIIFLNLNNYDALI